MHHHKQNKRDKLLEQEKHIKAKLQVEQIMVVQKAPAMEQQLVKLEVVDPEELLHKMREFLRIRNKN